MAIYTDQTGRTTELTHRPERIISLVPSQTELLYHLELDDTVAGITRFCTHPVHWKQTKKIIGGTKDINQDLILSLNPDLILAAKEENIKEQVEALAEDFPVWVSDVTDLDSANEMIRQVGAMTGTEAAASKIIGKVESNFSNLPQPTGPIPAAYLIWRKPYMTIGGDTFIHHIMEQAGFANVFGNSKRYPAVDVAMLSQSGCKVVLLSSEPFPFREKHVAELKEQLPGIFPLLVDGTMFSWYGSRLQQVPFYLQALRKQVSEAIENDIYS